MIRITSMATLTALLLTACTPAPEDQSAADAAPEPVIAAEVPATPATADPSPVAEPATDAEQEETEIQTVGYPEGWEMQPYWSGEYPKAFSVTQEGVTVMGHEVITHEQYPPIYCGLPNKATYSPWNAERRESDNLEFVSMVYPTTFTIMEDVSVQVLIGDGTEQLQLKTGDQMIYKSYIAEGFFIMEKDGILYELNENELPHSTEFERGPEDQEWVLVTCNDAEKTRAWVLYEDALKAPGVDVYHYTGFAEASDLP